jgi:hypothetical protein
MNIRMINDSFTFNFNRKMLTSIWYGIETVPFYARPCMTVHYCVLHLIKIKNKITVEYVEL